MEVIAAACIRSMCREMFFLCNIAGSSSKSSYTELGAVDAGELGAADEIELLRLDDVRESWLDLALLGMPIELLRAGITIDGRLCSVAIGGRHMLRLEGSIFGVDTIFALPAD